MKNTRLRSIERQMDADRPPRDYRIRIQEVDTINPDSLEQREVVTSSDQYVEGPSRDLPNGDCIRILWPKELKT